MYLFFQHQFWFFCFKTWIPGWTVCCRPCFIWAVGSTYAEKCEYSTKAADKCMLYDSVIGRPFYRASFWYQLMACFLGIAGSDWLQGQEAEGANLACSLITIVVLERLQSCEQDLRGLRRQQVGNFFLCHSHTGKQMKYMSGLSWRTGWNQWV